MQNPPFKSGDMVRCHARYYSTVAFDEVAQVKDCIWGYQAEDWVIKLVGKPSFVTGYRAKNFHMVSHLPWFDWVPSPTISITKRIETEKTEMHLAVDITSNPKLDPAEVHESLTSGNTLFCQDKSLALVKRLVAEELADNPGRKFAIFSLAYIAEVDEPRPPVRFRDMR